MLTPAYDHFVCFYLSLVLVQQYFPEISSGTRINPITITDKKKNLIIWNILYLYANIGPYIIRNSIEHCLKTAQEGNTSEALEIGMISAHGEGLHQVHDH